MRKSAPSERYDTTVRRGARAGWAIGAEAGEAADQRHASPVDFFFWGVPATAASPKACMYPCPAAPLRLWPLLTVALRPRYATAIGPVPPRYEHTISYRWSTVRVLRAQSFGTQKHYRTGASERITIFIEIGKTLCTFFPN